MKFNKADGMVVKVGAVLILSIYLAFGIIGGCARYAVHPGAINPTDSRAYDSLLIAKTLIDTARDQFATGVLPVRLKPAVNEVIKAYDIAMPAYKTWHTSLQSGNSTPDQYAKVTAALSALDLAITAFKGAK